MIVIQTDLSVFVVTMHKGLYEQYVKSLGLKVPGFDFLFARSPCIVTTNPSRTGHKIPQITHVKSSILLAADDDKSIYVQKITDLTDLTSECSVCAKMSKLGRI